MRACCTRWMLALCLSWTAPAQRHSFKQYDSDEGLTSPVVTNLLQDRTGFLWAGTHSGLIRYDGARFRHFGKSDGLPSAEIRSLHETVDGTLWVGTRTGLARRRGDRFEAVPLGASVEIRGRSALASDASGRLYVGVTEGLAVVPPAELVQIGRASCRERV